MWHASFKTSALLVATALSAFGLSATLAQAQFNSRIGELVAPDMGASMFATDNEGQFEYFTPRRAGLELGFSYAPENNSVRVGGADRVDYDGAIDFGARFHRSVGGVDLSLSGRVGTADDPRHGRDDPTIWSTGVGIALGPMTITGAFAEQSTDDTGNEIAYDAGVSYHTGPWGFALNYTKGRRVDDEASLAQDEARLEQYLLALNYRIARDVEIGAYGGYVRLDSDTATAAPSNDPSDVDGFVIGTGFRLEF